MIKENRWSGGKRHFVLPPLLEDLKGRHGCSLQRATFDKAIGEEIYVLYMEEPEFASQYSEVSPFNLFANFGLVRTPHGIVAFVVWRIAAGSPQEVSIEQFLNPQNIGALRLVASVANQTHLKLIVIDNESSEVTAFVDFENVFDFDRLSAAMVSAIGHEPEGDFGAAMKYVMNTTTVPELLAGGAPDDTA